MDTADRRSGIALMRVFPFPAEGPVTAAFFSSGFDDPQHQINTMDIRKL
jgi:hypothetical protein